MKQRWFGLIAVALAWTAALMVLLWVVGGSGSATSQPAWAAAPDADPTITEIDPTSAPSDLDMSVVITGTNFEGGAEVWLDGTALQDVTRVSDGRLEATVPWGMNPGVYGLNVYNPGGGSGYLPNAFTVTQGIAVWNAGALYGGNIERVVINPITPTTVYAVDHKTGIFRSRDGGETWSLVIAPGGHDLALDPITPTTVYWGTGGLYRSDDEMDTRDYLGSVVNLPYPHPTISGTLFATRRWDFGSGGGLWKSTNRGLSWVTATLGLTDTAVTGLVFHPTDPMTMYLGTAYGNIFRSTDGGDSWSHVAQPINYILTLAINPRSAHELWVSNFCLDRPNLTLKSSNPGHTAWITLEEPVGTMPLESIDFPPLAWGEAFSQTVFAQACFIGTYRTTDDGDTWEEALLGGDSINDIALHPAISNTLYGASRFEGVFKSEDGGETYRVINQGITAFDPLQMATVPGQPDVVYAVMDRPGGIYKGTEGGANWQFLAIEEGLRHIRSLSVDPFTPTRVYVGEGDSDGAWRIHISETGGETWLTPIVVSATEQYSDCNFFSPDVLRADPAQPGTLLAAVTFTRFGTPLLTAGGFYRSTDYGETWAYIDPGEVVSEVNDIAYDREITTVVYAATGWGGDGSGSGMLRSTDSGQHWQPMGEGIAALDAVWSLATEPHSPYRVYAMTFDDGVYVSANHGLTWTQATGKWFGCEEILCTDEAPSWLYAATGGGLLRSDNGGQSWSAAAGVLGQVPVYSLATVRDGERVILYAGTTGGYVEGDAAAALSQVDAEGTLVNAGVYRYTTLRRWWVYLPLIVRQQ
jgi:photosystem II stability/assembly factor-like uncharacterized protein